MNSGRDPQLMPESRLMTGPGVSSRHSKKPPTALGSESLSPRAGGMSPKMKEGPMSSIHEGATKSSADEHFLLDKLRADVSALKKKTEFLQTLLNK